MSRTTVGLLATVAAVMSGLVGLVHGDVGPILLAMAGGASGLAAYLALPSSKKVPRVTMKLIDSH